MSNKGKERETAENSDDSDVDFFTVKRRLPRPVVNQPPPPRSPTPPPRRSGSDSDLDEPIRSKRPTTKRAKPKLDLPDWTRTHHEPKKSVKRGSTETRGRESSRSAPVVIESSDDEGGNDSKGKDKAKANGEAPKKRKRYALTPPPELSEEKRAQIHQAVESAFAQPVMPPSDNDTHDPSSSAFVSSPPSSRAAEDTMTITIRMVAPPERVQTASAKAIQQYEKRREFTLARSQPLYWAVKALAQSLHKAPEDLVLVHRGIRLFSTRPAPSALGISDGDELSGYEKAAYETIVEEKRQARQRELLNLSGASEPDTNSLQRAASPSPTKDTTPIPSNEPTKMRISLLGSKGICTRKFPISMTAATLCRYYAEKHMKDMTVGGKLRLSVDGEVVDPGTRLEDMDVEDEDQVDVVLPDTRPKRLSTGKPREIVEIEDD